MKCSVCNEKEIIKIYKPDNVRFECKNGHIWFEDYKDNGGTHRRPYSYDIQLEDILFPSEKEIYRKLLNDIEKNNSFYNTADPMSKAKSFMKNCNITEEEMLALFRKIRDFEKIKEIIVQWWRGEHSLIWITEYMEVLHKIANRWQSKCFLLAFLLIAT